MKCICDIGYKDYGWGCGKDCGPFGIWQPNQIRCVCIGGYVDDENGGCRKQCPVNSEYNKISKLCVCK